jgi:hypothetical protein
VSRVSNLQTRQQYVLRGNPLAHKGKTVTVPTGGWKGHTELVHERYWRPEEEAYLREWHGRVPEAEIAAQLGRTPIAVQIRRIKLGLAPANSDMEYWTTTSLAPALGLAHGTVGGWMTTPVYGFVPHPKTGELVIARLEERELPVVLHWMRQKPVKMVKKVALLQWLADPLNHWLLASNPRVQIRDKQMARVVHFARLGWGDEWLTAQQVAERYHVGVGAVRQWVRLGWLPQSVRQGGYRWFIRHSEAAVVARRLYGKVAQ